MSLKGCRDMIETCFKKMYPELSFECEEALIGGIKIISKGVVKSRGQDNKLSFTAHIGEIPGADLPYLVSMYFDFGTLGRTAENFELMNQFNTTVPYFKCGISEVGYFTLYWTVPTSSAKAVVNIITSGINMICNMNKEDSLLKKLTARTNGSY